MNPHNHVYVKIKFLNEKYPKLKIYILELTLNSYGYKPAVHIIMHCMI